MSSRLVEQVHRQVDQKEAERLARKVVKGKGFDLTDLRSQLEQVQKMGGLGALMDKLPVAATAKGALSADRAIARSAARSPSSIP